MNQGNLLENHLNNYPENYSGNYQENYPENHLDNYSFSVVQALNERKVMYCREFMSMGEQISNVVHLGAKAGRTPEIVVIEVKSFYEVLLIIAALKEQKTVCLDLAQVNGETGQRIIDFLAGGAIAIDCQQACIGAEVLLLTPASVVLNQSSQFESLE